MAHHLTKKKSRLQNAEKASVAAIVAQNNETLSKLISTERSNFSDQRNNTYIDNKGVTRDAIGREVEVGSGYDLHSGITPADKSINNVQADYTLNGNAQKAIMSDEKVHEAAKVGEQLKEAWKEGVISAFGNKDNELASYKESQVELFTEVAKNNEKIRAEQDLSDQVDDMIKVAEKKAKETQKNLNYQRDAKLLAESEYDAAGKLKVVDQSQGLHHDTSKVVKQKIEDEFKLVNQGVAIIEAEETLKEITKERAEKERLAQLHSDQMHAQTYGRNEDGSLAEPGTELSGLDRLEEEGFSQRLNQKLNEEKAAKIASVKQLAETSPLGAEQSERLSAQKQQQNFESAKNNSTLGQNFGLKEEADRKIAKEREEKRLHEQQINSETADNIAGESSFYNQQRGTGGKDRGKFRKLQAEKKAAKAKADAAVNASENAFQEDNGAVNVRSMMRGGANDPYHFTTLAYPPDAVNSQENGHFMLFYVNVQNKTKYAYNGLKNGQVVPVGDMVATPTFVDDGSGRRGGSGGGSKLITEYKPGAQAAGLAGPVEYQKQMIRNGGKGNIIYNNQTILSKGRKSPGQNLASKYPTTTRITDSVALYLPSGIGNSQSVSYGDFETGVAGYLTMSGLDVAKALQEDDFVGAATQLFDKGGTLITDAIKKLALAGLETVGGGDGLQQNFDKIFGQTLNPYIEVAFQSTGMRTFDYTFKFAPKSKAETDEVKAIINLFRFHMLPEMKGTAHRYLTLPSTFDIHYMWQSGQTAAKENSFYNKIATCVLTNVSVNYTPNDEVQSFADGAPTQIAMSLSFKETEMMTKQHVNEGF